MMIPFTWNEHNSNLSQIILFEKDFSSIKQEYDLIISLNEIILDHDFFEFNISDPKKNFLKINIPSEDLLKIKNKLNLESNENILKLEILLW